VPANTRAQPKLDIFVDEATNANNHLYLAAVRTGPPIYATRRMDASSINGVADALHGFHNAVGTPGKLGQSGTAQESSLIGSPRASSERLSPRLRKCTGQEDGAILSACPSGPYQEDDILAALQASLYFVEVIVVVDELLIDF
jgi:hypothetical protein